MVSVGDLGGCILVLEWCSDKNETGTSFRVAPFAPGEIMAKTVDKLNEETIKFSLFLFLNSLYKTLLNWLAALVTISVGEFSFLEVVACSLFLALEISGHFWNVVGLCMSWSFEKRKKRYEYL